MMFIATNYLLTMGVIFSACPTFPFLLEAVSELCFVLFLDLTFQEALNIVNKHPQETVSLCMT